MPSGPQLELSGIVTRAAMQIFAHVQARQHHGMAVTTAARGGKNSEDLSGTPRRYLGDISAGAFEG